MTSRPEIGWIGTGALGGAIVARLLDSGYAVVAYNRTRARLEPLVRGGASPARSPAVVAQRARIVFLSLNGTEALEQTVFGPDGLLASPRLPMYVVDTSTLSPVVARNVHARLARVDTRYVDCPVSGGPEGARRGDLTAVVSGASSSDSDVISVIRGFAARVLFAGDPGNAQIIKLANNLAESVNLWGAAEAIAIGLHAGVEQELLLEALSTMRGSSLYLGVLAERLRKPSPTVSATLDVRLKDLRLVQELANDLSLEARLADTVAALFAQTAETFGSERDQTTCFELVAGGKQSFRRSVGHND